MTLRRTKSGFSEIYLSLLDNLPLVLQMIRREVVGRYRGSLFGLLWSFFNPVLMLTVYTFVFSMVFKSRWGQGNDNRYGFALTLFAGLIVFNLFSECVSRAPGLILSNVNYVKKVIFPLEILPWVSLGSSLFHACVSLAVLLVFLLLLGMPLSWTVLLLPAVVLPLLPLIMGITWLLASVGVFVRDIGQFIGLAMTVLMFMSPIFYPVSALPESVRGYLFLNPMTFIIEQTREVLIFDRVPNLGGLAIYSCISVLVAWAGLSWFQKTRKGFADVL